MIPTSLTTCECFGGPLDGQLVNVDARGSTVRFPWVRAVYDVVRKDGGRVELHYQDELSP
jgi:hypothetical protein